jgi:two-component system KDP operon response regulator KdpE
VTVDGTQVNLTRTEWLLVAELAKNAGRLMLYEELLTRVWGQEYRNDMQLLRTSMSRLRRKLKADSSHHAPIRTVPKTGFIMEEAPPG